MLSFYNKWTKRVAASSKGSFTTLLCEQFALPRCFMSRNFNKIQL